MGQIFATDLGADGFCSALDTMAPGLADELGYLHHPWFRRWLELVQSHSARLCTHWVARTDVQASIVLPEDTPTQVRPFSLSVFSLDYGLAYSLHRDCIIASTKKLVLKRYLQYEQAALKHAFPAGSTLHGTSVERSAYLWIARPPKIRSWHKDMGIAGFLKPETLPAYFQDRVAIYVGWNEPAPSVPWESNEEAQLRLSEEDVFDQSDLASQIIAHAGRKRVSPPSYPPPLEEVIMVSSSAAGVSAESGDLWDLLDRRDTKRTRFGTTQMIIPPMAASAGGPSSSLVASAVDELSQPNAPVAMAMQYAPARSRVGQGHLPFGRSMAHPAPTAAFNPFPADTEASTPRYSTMHSPEKRSVNVVAHRASSSEVRRSLKALLDPSVSGSSGSQWTFTDVHMGSRSARAHAKLSCLLAIHDVQWEGFIQDRQPVPEEWKIFPGPLWDQFRERFFGTTSTTKDAIDWLKSEYRQDQQARLTDHRLRPNIEDAFWQKDLFDALRSGNWSSSHQLQPHDVDDHFSVFSFILSVDARATWPPRLPSDGIAIADMIQLGRNLTWFMDLALAQPGQPGSLFLDFSLLGEAVNHQFELLDHRGLAQQWDASPDSRCRHSYAFLFCLHRLMAEMHRWFSSIPLVFHVSPAGSPLNHVMALSLLIAN
jgi:hypothetical protein